MIKWITTLAVCAVACLSSFTAGATNPENNNIAVKDNPSPYKLQPGDEYMPSLTEMLGGRCDNLPDLSQTSDLSLELIDYAKKFIGTRYRSGAKGPKAFDCSGFTSYVFKKFDLALASSSRGQAVQGERVSLSEAQPGDLVFFSGSRNRKSVGHVGIVVDVDENTGKVKFIHAATSKGVAIDTYPDGGYYSKRFMHIQRMLPA